MVPGARVLATTPFELAELAGVGQFDRQLEVWNISTLGTGLIDSTVTPHRVRQRLAFGDCGRARFFAVYIFARLGREDRSHRVPAVAGRDQQCVDVVTGQNIEHVRI